MTDKPEKGDSANSGRPAATGRMPAGAPVAAGIGARDATGPADAIHAPDTLAGQDASHIPFRGMPMEIESFRHLAEFALDLRWAWNANDDWVWRRIDPVLWDLTHNPWAVLRAASRARIEHLCADAQFRGKLDELRRIRRERRDKPGWFQQAHGHGALRCVAYFSMEFMLGEALPIYSGGLGNVAGDQLKAASDMGVPVVGVGLLYQQGYFRQVIDRDGAQQAMYPYNDPGQLPIRPLRGPDGEYGGGGRMGVATVPSSG